MMQVQNNNPQVYSKPVLPAPMSAVPVNYQVVRSQYPVYAQSVYYAPVNPALQQYNIMASTCVYNDKSQSQTKTVSTPVNGFISSFIQKAKQVVPVTIVDKNDTFVWKNDLRSIFQNNQAVIYALIMRTFNSKDMDGDGLIDPAKGEKTGTFINAIDRLDELKGYGVNTLHLLPIHPPGKKEAMGIAGSIYAPLDFLALDPKLDDPDDPANVNEEAKKFTKECHKRGIRVMVDLPSCASLDFYEAKKEELMAVDELGRPKVPQGWNDIRMLDPKKKAVLDLHKKYVDMCIDLGIDGIRADVARAKPVEFWDELINYARSKDPQFAFLAESYTYEDASPMLNMPHDRPEDLLRSGFDSYYGQYHIFHEWKGSKDFHDNMILNLEMTQKLPANKSLIGSFATHDDKSPMSHGGISYCNLTTGLQATLPMTNPYVITGFEAGDNYIYTYKDKISSKTDTDNYTCDVHAEKLDIFNYSRKPGGEHPEIGDFMGKMMEVRKQYEDVLTKGSYIPLKVDGNKNDQIIAYARHLNGKTVIAVANKDVNAKQSGQINIPGLKSEQPLNDLAPSYGVESQYQPQKDSVLVELGPARFHMFEVDDKDIEKLVDKVYRQNIDPNPVIG